MQTALCIIGLILVYCALMMRFRRNEDYQHDLEQADYERKTAQFWNMGTKFEDERIAEIKKEGYGNWKTRLKFNVVSATTRNNLPDTYVRLWHFSDVPPGTEECPLWG
jgi:hypothetical protein